MCPVAEIASCQLSFIPMQAENYLLEIDKVLHLIASSSMEHSIGDMSTVIKGDKAEILELISNIYDLMANQCSFILDIRLSNVCGCRP